MNERDFLGGSELSAILARVEAGKTTAEDAERLRSLLIRLLDEVVDLNRALGDPCDEFIALLDSIADEKYEATRMGRRNIEALEASLSHTYHFGR